MVRRYPRYSIHNTLKRFRPRYDHTPPSWYRTRLPADRLLARKKEIKRLRELLRFNKRVRKEFARKAKIPQKSVFDYVTLFPKRWIWKALGRIESYLIASAISWGFKQIRKYKSKALVPYRPRSPSAADIDAGYRLMDDDVRYLGTVEYTHPDDLDRTNPINRPPWHDLTQDEIDRAYKRAQPYRDEL